MNSKFKRTEFILNITFCNIILFFTVTFDQYHASLLKKSINFLKKKILLTPNFRTVLYILYKPVIFIKEVNRAQFSGPQNSQSFHNVTYS